MTGRSRASIPFVARSRLVAALLGLLAGALAMAPSAFAAPPAKKKPSPPAVAPSTTSTASPPATSSVRAVAEKTVEAGPAPSRAPSKGEASAAGASKSAVVAGRPIPPELRDRLRVRIEARIDRDLARSRKLRDDAIALLSAFVAETPPASREVPEALLRLGELKWEVEREAFVARFKAWESKPVDQRGPAPEPDVRPSRELFARVIKNYPRFPQMDLALYVDGFLAYEQGKQDEALARFEAILRRYPGSRFVPDAHMAKAEALFNGKYDYEGALAEYEKVLSFQDSELYGLALFKSAWCMWRLGRTEDAAKRFVGVFEVADGGAGRSKVSVTQQKQLDELQSEALKYLVEVFTEDEKNTAQDVYVFLTKIGGDRFAGKVVRALAVQFYDQAHYDQGMAAYELLLKLEPASPEAGTWVLRIAEGAAAVEDYDKLAAIYRRATTGYTAGSAWAKSQADPEIVRKTTEGVERQLRQDALLLHARAQKDKTSRAEFRAAASLYEVYLGRFSGSEQASRIEYYLAEIYFYRLDDGQAAATHYMAAARAISNEQAKTEPLRAVRHDAIYNAMASLEQVRFREREARKKTAGEGAPLQESEADKKFAEALDLYAQLYPDDPALPDLFFRQGKQYYDDGVYDAAVKIWGSLVEKFPKSPYALSAGELILDSFSRAKDYENIEAWARRLKRAPSFATEANQRKLDTLIVQAVFKQGEQKSAAGQHGPAALAYLRAAKEFPHDARAAQACVNAELEAQRAGDLATLKEAAKLVVGKDYRDKPESPEGAWTAATVLQSMGLFAESAEFHETIVTLGDREHPHYAKFPHAKDAAYDAVVLRVATGENDKAVANGNRYLQKYGSSADADDVVFQMGKAHQNAGRNKEAAELYRRYVARSKNQDYRVQGYVLLASALVATGDERGAGEALKSAVEIGRRKKGELGPEGKYAAAHARYMEGERVLAKFDKIQIQGDVKQLSGRLKQKADLLKEASNVFLDVVSLGVAEWTTAALYQIGRTYEQFANALRDAPVPSGLSDADKEQYQQQIDEFVVPIEERSLDAYENGWKKAIELQIYNPWTAKMRDALGRLNAELYPPFKEIGFEASAQDAAPLPALIEAPRRDDDRGAGATAGASAPARGAGTPPVATTPAATAKPAKKGKR